MHIIHTLLPALFVLAIGIAFMSVRVLVKKHGSFRMGHACRFRAPHNKNNQRKKQLKDT